jgi:Ser/Thr protein kinase RdoA (MazF antagonist)
LPDFAPLYSTPRPETVAKFVERRYPLAGPLRCRMLNRGFNDVYLVAAASGERFVFRLSQHRARGKADVRTETDFLIHLAGLGTPVAAPVQSRSGEMFVLAEAPEGRREGVLFCALHGRSPEPASGEDARANGATLARVHNGAETFRAEAPLYRLDLDHLLRRPLKRINDCGIVEDAPTRDELQAIGLRTADRIEAFGDLAWTHCHGDCHGFNARVDAAGTAAFFDFDDGGPGYLAYDLSVFLWAKVSFRRDLASMWEPFIEGYRRIRPISPVDLEAAQAFVIVRHIWLMGEYASRTDEYGSDNVEWIAREAEFLRRWEDERLRGRLF